MHMSVGKNQYIEIADPFNSALKTYIISTFNIDV